MTEHCTLPTQDRLRELFTYKQEEGALYWIRRHNSQIDLSRPAGWSDSRGYHGIRVDGKRYRRHRIIWCYFNGDPGQLEIDHVNGIKSDDRIENLRIATRSENQYNRPALITNKSGFKGVSECEYSRWKAQITTPGGKRLSLGYFATPEEAAVAYARAAASLHKDFAHESVRALHQ